MPRTRPARVHQLKVVLRDTEVWRRLQVPSTMTLAQLHDVIQRAAVNDALAYVAAR